MRERTAPLARNWEVLALLFLAAAVYQPWSASALPILDFSEFLPHLAGHGSPFAQFAAVVQYMETQGRFSPLLYVQAVIAWNAFGMWAPGWHWMYFALDAAVLMTGRQFLLELGLRRSAVFAAVAVWIVAPSVAAASVRLTGEPTGLLFLIAALRMAHNYQDATDWRRHALLIAGCAVGMILAKEILAVLLPVIWLMTRLRHREGEWEWADWSRRDVRVTAASATAAILALLPVAFIALTAQRGSYAGRYGTATIDLKAVIIRLETVLLPSRAGLPSVAQLINDFSWQAWVTMPNLLWLSVFVAGLVVVIRSPVIRGSKWPMAIAALWILSGVAVYLPWPGGATFYMLPFAFGAAFAVAHFLDAMLASSTLRSAAVVTFVVVFAIGSVEARDIVHEHELRVMSDVKVLSAIARRGRTLPLVAAVPNPMPLGAFGWGRKFSDYGRVSGEIAPVSAHDVSCADGRRLLENHEAVVVVSAYDGCGQLAPGSVVITESVPRRRWPWLFDARKNRRTAFVARGGKLPPLPTHGGG